MSDYCPSPPLPEWEISPGQIPLKTPLVDLRWFVEQNLRLVIPPECPLGRAVALSENPSLAPSTPSDEERHYYVRLMQGYRLADWSVRALFARQTNPARQITATVPRGFVTEELLTVHGGRNQLPQPGGIGTLYTAGRLAQSGFGGRINISGPRRKGYDILYETRLGPMLIERKDRAYEDGLDDTVENQIQYVLERINRYGVGIPRQVPNAEIGDVARILSVGFWNGVFLSKEDFDAQFGRRIYAEFLKADPALQAHWPDCVIVEYLADYNYYVHGRLVLRPQRPEFVRIKPVIRAGMPEQLLLIGFDMNQGRPVVRLVRPFPAD